MAIISPKLKKMIERSDPETKFVIVENDEPQFVVLSIEEFERMSEARGRIKALTEEELISKINEDVALWRESQPDKKEEKEALVDEIESLDNIEYVSDLPKK